MQTSEKYETIRWKLRCFGFAGFKIFQTNRSLGKVDKSVYVSKWLATCLPPLLPIAALARFCPCFFVGHFQHETAIIGGIPKKKKNSFTRKQDAGERLAVHIAMRYGHFQTVLWMESLRLWSIHVIFFWWERFACYFFFLEPKRPDFFLIGFLAVF